MIRSKFGLAVLGIILGSPPSRPYRGSKDGTPTPLRRISYPFTGEVVAQSRKVSFYLEDGPRLRGAIGAGGYSF